MEERRVEKKGFSIWKTDVEAKKGRLYGRQRMK
jgi:hypothetical protein